jgi:hypothetical protein
MRDLHRCLGREVDDLYEHYVMPVFREWVLRQGDVTLDSGGSARIGNAIWRCETIDVRSYPEATNLICLSTSLKVPSYWKIPLLADKELCLKILLGDLRSPRQPTARYGSMIGGFIQRPVPDDKAHLLTIKIWRYKELGWDPQIISMSEGKLKATIVHELMHYCDRSIVSGSYYWPRKSLSKRSLSEHFNYLNQKTEIASKACELIELAKHYRRPLKDELDHCIEGVRRAVHCNPEINREELERELIHYRELLAAELVGRLPELKGEL